MYLIVVNSADLMCIDNVNYSQHFCVIRFQNIAWRKKWFSTLVFITTQKILTFTFEKMVVKSNV
jgi:hypothetical protein